MANACISSSNESNLVSDETTSALEELLEFLYLMPIGVVKFDAEGAIELLNPTAASLLLPGAPDGVLENIYTVMGTLLPDLHERVSDFVASAGNIIDQLRLETSTGEKQLVLSLTVNRISDSVYMALLENVTKIAAQERKIFEDREKFRAIFDSVRDYAIYTINASGVVEEWNQSLEHFAGWLPKDLQGRSIAMFFPLDDPNVPRLDLLLAEAGRIGSVETEGWRVRSDGSRLWGNSVITALADEVGSVRGFAVVERDMTERKRFEDEITLLATVDSLTGAYNRRQGDVLIAAEFARSDRGGQTFAALMLDVDHFKSINDRFGHPAGDAVLRTLVQTCRETLRSSDIVVRWGGEEFLIVLPGADLAMATLAAERVRATLADVRVPVSGGALIDFTVSIGVAVPNGSDPAELVKRSDIALYAAKTGGRNRVVLAE